MGQVLVCLFKGPFAGKPDLLSVGDQSADILLLIFYSINMTMNTAFLVTFYAVDSNPASPFRLCLVPPSIVVENIMACWVFRNGKLGNYPTLRIPRQTLSVDMFFVDSVFQAAAPEHFRRHGQGHDEETTPRNLEATSMVQVVPSQPHIPQNHGIK